MKTGILTKAKDVLDYSTVRLYTPLREPYLVSVTTSVEKDLVTIWTTKEDGTSGPTLTVLPARLIEVVDVPDLTLYGRVQMILKRWERVLEEVGDDDQYLGANTLYDELKEAFEKGKA